MMTKKKTEQYVLIKQFRYKRLFQCLLLLLLCLMFIHIGFLMQENIEEEDLSFNDFMIQIYGGILFAAGFSGILFILFGCLIAFDDIFIKTKYCPIVDVEVQES